MSDRLGDGQAPPVRQARSRHAGSAVRDGNEAVPLATQQPSSVAMLRTLRWLPLIRKWAMTFASSMTSYLGRGPALLQTNLRATSSSKVTVRNSGGGLRLRLWLLHELRLMLRERERDQLRLSLKSE